MRHILITAGIALMMAGSAFAGTHADLALATAESERARRYIEQGHFSKARDLLMAAEERIQTVAPQGEAAAAIASGKGDLARAQGDLDEARQYYMQAVAWLQAPGAAEALATGPLRNLGTIAAMSGDLEGARDYYGQSLAIAERAGDDHAAARVLNNLGIISVRRGDIASAEVFYQRALAINERLGAWRSHYINLYNLADVADARGDLDSAITLLRRSLAGFESLGEDSLRVAQSRAALADMLVDAGELLEASELFDAALASYERLAPDSPDVALAEIGLGNAASRLGDFRTAERHFHSALARRKAVSPMSVDTAQTHQSLGSLYLDAGNYKSTEQHLRQARHIYELLAPDSIELAQALYGLARVAEAREDDDYALQLYESAVAAIDAQTRRLGGADDARSLFGDKYSDYYKDYIDLLLASGLEAQAFAVLERYRSRSIVALLAERDLSFARDIPDSLLKERRRWQQEYDEAQGELIDKAGAAAPESELRVIRSRMTEIRMKRDGLYSRMREVASRYADLNYATPVDINTAGRALEQGTVALSYSVHADHTVLFVLAQDAFRTVRVDIGERALREKVRRFRFLIESGRNDAAPSVALLKAGAQLYDLLITPALIFTDAERYLLVPDGPLHTLPFAALVASTGSDHSDQWVYLVEQAPLHKAQSMTLYTQLAKGSDPATPVVPHVVVFGNTYKTGQVAAVDSTRFVEDLSNLQPLPFVKQEIDGINAVFPASTTVYTGVRATERNVMLAAPDASYLHFATHSVVNENVPLDSALVLLASDSSENGLLQAWEIVENLRTNASLVVLSACETALGMETAGDGLIGLTRAFHYAGARTVLASQWQVSDRSTAQLMVAFYQNLGRNMSKDAALQAAQLELLGNGTGHGKQRTLRSIVSGMFTQPAGFRHPYYWAAFELSGSRS